MAAVFQAYDSSGNLEIDLGKSIPKILDIRNVQGSPGGTYVAVNRAGVQNMIAFSTSSYLSNGTQVIDSRSVVRTEPNGYTVIGTYLEKVVCIGY